MHKLIQDHERQLSVMVFEGDITLPDHIEISDEFYKKPTRHLIIDNIRGGKNEMGYEELSAFVKYLSANISVRPQGKTAILVSQQVHYGISRMFSSIYESHIPSANVKIFSSRIEAEDWIFGNNSPNEE